MNPRKTVEIKLSDDHSTVPGKEPRKTTLNLQKPVCKNGVCELVWKPVKPAA
jgi:hypothetical protein